MDNIYQIVVSVIAGFGGATAIIGVVIRFTSEKIADALQKKYQLKLDIELESYKSRLEGKEYVSKAYFDIEIENYRAVSKEVFSMVRDVSIMIPSGYTTVPADEEERKKADKRHYEAAFQAVASAQNIIYQNAPFIDENIYDSCIEICRLCKLQLDEYEERFLVTDLRPQKEKERFSREAYKRTREINEQYNSFTKLVRDYIKKLEII